MKLSLTNDDVDLLIYLFLKPFGLQSSIYRVPHDLRSTSVTDASVNRSRLILFSARDRSHAVIPAPVGSVHYGRGIQPITEGEESEESAPSRSLHLTASRRYAAAKIFSESKVSSHDEMEGTPALQSFANQIGVQHLSKAARHSR